VGEEAALTNPTTVSGELTVQYFSVEHPQSKQKLVLVDTPGFDHSNASDKQVWCIIRKAICESSAPSTHFTSNILIIFLIPRCSSNVLFGGVIYLHDITIQKPNFGTFWPIGHLARPEPASHVVLTMRSRDRMTDTDAIDREKELKASAWKNAIEGGARTGHFLNTHDSAWEAVDTLLELDPLELRLLRTELKKICKAFEKISEKPLPSKGFFSSLFSLFGRSQVCSLFCSVIH